jgi:hypothetical protein
MHAAKSVTALSLLLCFSAFAEEPHHKDYKSFLLGERATWDSTDHPKARGMRIKISYPKSWAAEEASRPNTAQQFTSESGRGLEMLMVQIRPLPEFRYDEYAKLSKEERNQALEEVADAFASEGMRLVSHKVTQIDGEDCLMVEYEYSGQTAGMAIVQKLLSFIIPRDGALLILAGSVGGDGDSGFAGIEKRYAATKPLLQQIAASCVLTDKWVPKSQH